MTLDDFIDEDNDLRQPVNPRLLIDGSVSEDGSEEGNGEGENIGENGGFDRDDSEGENNRNGQNFPGRAYVDRFITIKGVPTKPHEDSPGYLTDPGFMEQFLLTSVGGKDQRRLIRDFWRLQCMGEGDGMANVVRSRSERFAINLLLFRARNDTPINATERSLFVEQRSRSTSTQKLIQQNGGGGKTSGFLSRFFGK